MKFIKDPVHGDIPIDDEDLPILDSPAVQRLRRVKQIGLGDLAYPGANHTRFEHSIGTMYLAKVLAKRLDLDHETARLLRVASLLHDVGHGPLSHTSEKFAIANFQIDHTEMTRREITGGSTAAILESCGLDPTEVSKISCEGKNDLGLLLHSQIGIDRMDYLVRDAHYTGVAYGVIDHQRIISTMALVDGSLAVAEKGMQAVESLLVARFLMYPTVYLHHVSRIADSMMLRALEGLSQEGYSVEQIMRMDDISLFNALRSAGGIPGTTAERLMNRDLFKRAVYLGTGQVADLDELIKISQDREKMREMEDEIAEAAGLESGDVLVDIQGMPPLGEGETMILVRGRLEPLRARSALVGSLEEARWAYWRLGVYCDRVNVDKVRRVCEEYGWSGVER